MSEFENCPVILGATALHVTIGARVLLDSQDLLLRAGERVGLIGRNGSGKSTLLRILSDEEAFYSGEVTLRKDVRRRYLPQAIVLDDGATLRENILAGAHETRELIRQYEALPHNAHERLADNLERTIAARDGWNLETRLQELASALDIPPLDRRAETLSGGEKRRVALAKTLVDLPELLLLDEPTNHLDTQTIEWLEAYLQKYSGTCLFITHDRYFLDRVCTRILELQAAKLYSYPGNYTEYLRQRAIRDEVTLLQENRRLAFIRRELDWIRRGPKARGTKSWSRIQRFNDAVNTAPPPVERDVELLLPPPARFGDIIARLTKVTLSRGGHTLFQNLDLNFEPGMRLGILGRNGLGKTSLLKLLLGELKPDAGEVRIGERTEMNYIDQHRVTLNDERTVVEEIGEGNDYVMFGNRKVAVWTYLRRFLFQDEEITTQVGQLSGGERNRLLLAKIFKNGGNFLLLDEPTNDLDLATLRILEETLMDFPGCVAVVSHDRYFLNRICTHILAFEGNGELFFQPGDYQYYVEKQAERTAAPQAPPSPGGSVQAPPPSAGGKGRLSYKEQRELAGLEEAIQNAEARVTELEELFATPDFHAKYGRQTAELTAQLEAARAEVEKLYDRWTELEERKS